MKMIPHSDLCFANGCTKKAKGYSRFCTKHVHREQAHGHELQEPITSVHLRDPLDRLYRWMRTSEGKTAVDAAVEHYVSLAERKASEYSDDIRDMMKTGIQWETPVYQARELIAETYQSKNPRKTVVELLALGLLLEESPMMFRSDRAFLCQATHVFLRGSAARTKYKFRRNQGRPIATTRHINRKVREELGRWLTKEFVFLGVLIYRQWQKKAAEEKRQREKVISAVRGEAPATA